MITKEQVLNMAFAADLAGQPSVYRALLAVAGRFDDATGHDHFDADMDDDEALARGRMAELGLHLLPFPESRFRLARAAGMVS